MRDAEGVDEGESECHLSHHRRRVRLAVRAALTDPFEDLAAIGQLHHEDGPFGEHKVLDERDDVAVHAKEAQYAPLLLHLLRRHPVAIYQLHRKTQPIALPHREAHARKGALAEDVAHFVALERARARLFRRLLLCGPLHSSRIPHRRHRGGGLAEGWRR